MFNNIGRKIKSLAKVLFVLGCIGSGLGAFAGFISAIDAEEIGIMIASILIGGVGVLVSYLSVLFMYAFGDLVDNTEENRKINQQILMHMQHGNAGYAAPVAPAAPVYNPAPAYTAPVSYAAPAAPVEKPWFCTRCGNQNTADSAVCTSCGNPKSTF